jgi:subtilisin family serine protease
MRRIFVMVMVLSLALASVGLAAELWQTPIEPPEDVTLPKYVPNKIVVKFDPQTVGAMNRETARRGRLGIPALDHLGAQLGAASIAPQFPGAKKKMVRGKVFDLSGWHVVKFEDKVDVQEAVAAYKALPGVINAHPVSFLKAYREPAEQFVNFQWYLDKIDAFGAWDLQTGSPDIVIAILDSGVRYFAADMAGIPNPLYSPEPYPVANWDDINGNMWINEAERLGLSGQDDDGNGFLNDWIGWDFVDGGNTSGLPDLAGEDYTTEDNDPRDFNGHGTQCASIAGAITNNNEAGAGVAGGWWPDTPGVKIMPLRIAYSVGYLGLLEVAVGDTALAASALVYAADQGARIASFSYGASVNDGTMDAALNYFLNNGDGINGEGLFFAAAGNSASNKAPYPQSYPHPNVIVVGGTDRYDAPWFELFSGGTNYGDWVDISAPAVEICTLTHLSTDPATDYFLDPYYTAVTGTSFACPMVAGVAALMWSQNPQLAAEQIRSVLLDSDNCDTINPNLWPSAPPPDQLGAGRVNAYKAVSAVSTTPPSLPDVATESPVAGKYVGKRKNRVFVAAKTFTQGESVVIQVQLNPGVANATVAISISGPSSTQITLTDTTDAAGMAELTWKTQAPVRRGKKQIPGTTAGDYTATVTKVIAEGYDWDGEPDSTIFTIAEAS